MKLQQWGLAAEVVSAIAVVLSLIFVGLQVKQNSDAQTQTGTQAVITEYNNGVRALSMDPELVCIYLRGAHDYLSLSGAERVRFSSFFLSMFNVQQQIYRLRLNEEIDEDIGAGLDEQLKDIARLPGVYQWFESRANWYGRDFRAYIESAHSEPAKEDSVLLLIADPACMPNGPAPRARSP
jgi:hypothetical protein